MEKQASSREADRAKANAIRAIMNDEPIPLAERIMALIENGAAGWETDGNNVSIHLALNDKDAKAIDRYGRDCLRRQDRWDEKSRDDVRRMTARMIETDPEWGAAYKKWSEAHPRTQQTPSPRELFGWDRKPLPLLKLVNELRG